jgi:hypothetical protein
MNCRKVRSYLSAFSESSLSPDKRDDLEAHIRNCKSCEREKLYIDEILVAARALPAKSLPEDFNLKLFNRIYAEQNNPTESYLPLREPSLLRRPAAWVSAVGTLAVSAVVTLLFLNVGRVPLPVADSAPAFTQTQEPIVAQYTSSRHKDPVNIYENIIGVSGASSNYRSTNAEQLRTLHLADAKVESLMIEMQRKLGYDYASASGMMVRAADSRRIPYYTRSRVAPSAGLVRNASASY